MLTMGTSSFSKLPYFTRGGGVRMVLGNQEILDLDPQLNVRPQRNSKPAPAVSNPLKDWAPIALSPDATYLLVAHHCNLPAASSGATPTQPSSPWKLRSAALFNSILPPHRHRSSRRLLMWPRQCQRHWQLLIWN